MREFFIKVEEEDGAATVEVVSEIPDDAEFLICLPYAFPLELPDNQLGRCAACDRPIQFRPVRPSLAKVCFHCAPAWIVGRRTPN